MSKAANVFRRRADAFEALISRVADDQWPAQSPCKDWDARDVVTHVVTKLRDVLRPLGRTPTPAPTVEGDPLEAFRVARRDVEAVLDDPVLAKSRTQSSAGTWPAEEMIDRVVSQDIVIHGWDLAKATGQVASLNLLDVRAIFPLAASSPPQSREPGAYARQVKVPEGAPAQDRLLAMLGRDPRWTPPKRRRRR